MSTSENVYEPIGLFDVDGLIIFGLDAEYGAVGEDQMAC